MERGAAPVARDRRVSACSLYRDTNTSLNFTAMKTSPHGSPHEGHSPSSPQQTTMYTNALSNPPKEDEGWQPVTRRRARQVKQEQLRPERLSRAHFCLAIRPLHKISRDTISKQALWAPSGNSPQPRASRYGHLSLLYEGHYYPSYSSRRKTCKEP